MATPALPRPAWLSRSQCSDGFKARGWVTGKMSKGDLYFDGKGGSDHPHLHLRVSGEGGARDIRNGVSLLAWSDGKQGTGGGGKTFIDHGTVLVQAWQSQILARNMNASMTEEFSYIMSYFTQG